MFAPASRRVACAACVAMLSAAPGAPKSLLIDFSAPAAAADWQPVDDRIMGGRSASRVIFAGGATAFEGRLVVEGGGFASARYLKQLSLASDVEALALDACSDGRMGYKLTLQSAAAPDGVSYQYTLPPLESGGSGYTSVRMPLREFKPTYRGRPAPEAPPLRAPDVRGAGLMLSRYESGGGTAKASIPAGEFRLTLRALRVAESDLAVNSRRWVSPPARPRGSDR